MIMGDRRVIQDVIHTFDICYVSVILKVGSERVISFFNRANLFLRVCPFLVLLIHVMNKN
jgi:hypothetical protein